MFGNINFGSGQVTGVLLIILVVECGVIMYRKSRRNNRTDKQDK